MDLPEDLFALADVTNDTLQGSNSSNSCLPGIPDATPDVIFLKWYAVIAVATGCFVNLSCLIYLLLVRRKNIRFLPQLFGVVFGNALFLLLYAWNLIALANPPTTDDDTSFQFQSESYCKVSLFLMGAMRQFPHLCMTAVSLEQMVVIWRNPYARIRASIHFCRHVAIVLSLAALCLLLNAWIIPLAALHPFFNNMCSASTDARRQPFYASISTTSIFLLDFCPYVVMLLCHTELIYKLHKSCKVKQSTQTADNLLVFTDITMRQTKSERMIRNRRRTVFQLIAVITIIATLNLPNNILNMVRRFTEMSVDEEDLSEDYTLSSLSTEIPCEPFEDPTPLAEKIPNMIVFVLYNFQFSIAALYVQLPLFRNRRSRRASSGSSGSLNNVNAAASATRTASPRPATKLSRLDSLLSEYETHEARYEPGNCNLPRRQNGNAYLLEPPSYSPIIDRVLTSVGAKATAITWASQGNKCQVASTAVVHANGLTHGAIANGKCSGSLVNLTQTQNYVSKAFNAKDEDELEFVDFRRNS